MILDKIAEFIENGEYFLVTSHLNADGDAIASVLAIRNILKQKNKKFKIVLHDSTLNIGYQFLDGFEEIISFQDFHKESQGSFTHAIIVDAPGYKRIADVVYIMPPKENVLKIDHHPSEDDFEINYVDETRSSAAEMLIEVIKHMKIDMDSGFSNIVYTGIAFDTGNFRFSNTTYRTLDAAAFLVECGAEPALISNNLYYSKSFGEIKILGKVLSNLETFENGKVALLYLPMDLLEELLSVNGETEGFVDYTVSIKGIKVGAFIRQSKDDEFKISLRSHSTVSVDDIARRFGGGGHLKAAGCRISGTYEEVRKTLLNEIAKHV